MSSSNGAGADAGAASAGPGAGQRIGSALTAFGSYGQPQQGQQQQQQPLPYVIGDPNQQRQPTLYERLTGALQNF